MFELVRQFVIFSELLPTYYAECTCCRCIAELDCNL